MAQWRRYLVARVIRLSTTRLAFAEDQAVLFAACPEAAQYSDDEAEDFFTAAFLLDNWDAKAIITFMRRLQIPVPAGLVYDEYRLSRHLLCQWRQPKLRQAFVDHGPQVDLKAAERDRRNGNHDVLLHTIELVGSVNVLACLRQRGQLELAETVLGLFTPEQMARHRALIQFAKILLHRCLTEPEPPAKPSRWDQQRLVKRLRLREVQMRAMRRSLHTLRLERKALMTSLRERGRQEQPELAQYAVQLRELRDQRAEAARRHAADLAEQTARHEAEIARLREQLVAARQDYATAVRLRSSWLPKPGGE